MNRRQVVQAVAAAIIILKLALELLEKAASLLGVN